MFDGHPLFDSEYRLTDQLKSLDAYPTLQRFLDQVGEFAWQDWQVSAEFLKRHLGSPGSYSRFRGELQRFLNFLWIERNKSLSQATSDDLEEYRAFIRSPHPHWMTVPRGDSKNPPPGSGRQRSFLDDQERRRANPYWRPFAHSDTKPKKATEKAMLAVLSAFFKNLVDTQYIRRSPTIGMSKRVRSPSSGGVDEGNSQTRNKKERPQVIAPRLTVAQWIFLHDTLLKAADENPKYEPHLFVVVTMKTLYLRVFELAPHGARSGDEFEHEPVMGDFNQITVENHRYWHLYVHGKGDEPRDIPLPEAYLPYLIRYRAYRGLPRLPLGNETYPLVSQGCTNEPYRSKRSIERIVEQAFQLAVKQKFDDGEPDAAAELAQFSQTTHILRHTGASMDIINNGRPLRDVSEDLGHSSPAFTESVYIDTDTAQRYTTGLKRPVL